MQQKMVDNLGILVLAGVLATAADYYLKIWSKNNQSDLLAGALIIYLISILVFALSLKTGDLLTNGAVYVLINALGFLILSQVVFNERITQVQVIGIIIAIISIILIEFK